MVALLPRRALARTRAKVQRNHDQLPQRRRRGRHLRHRAEQDQGGPQEGGTGMERNGQEDQKEQGQIAQIGLKMLLCEKLPVWINLIA